MNINDYFKKFHTYWHLGHLQWISKLLTLMHSNPRPPRNVLSCLSCTVIAPRTDLCENMCLYPRPHWTVCRDHYLFTTVRHGAHSARQRGAQSLMPGELPMNLCQMNRWMIQMDLAHLRIGYSCLAHPFWCWLLVPSVQRVAFLWTLALILEYTLLWTNSSHLHLTLAPFPWSRGAVLHYQAFSFSEVPSWDEV